MKLSLSTMKLPTTRMWKIKHKSDHLAQFSPSRHNTNVVGIVWAWNKCSWHCKHQWPKRYQYFKNKISVIKPEFLWNVGSLSSLCSSTYRKEEEGTQDEPFEVEHKEDMEDQQIEARQVNRTES